MRDVFVKCFYFKGEVHWKNASESNDGGDHSLDVWKIRLHQDDSMPENMTGLLNSEEKERYGRYHKEEDKKRFAAGRVVLRILLGQYLDQDPEAVRIEEDVNKKPFVPNNGKRDLQFNLSHSGKCILVAVSKYDVGVDIEFISKNFLYDDIITSSFSVEEREFVKKSSQPDRAFYLLWTRKEALLKGTGKGLVDNLSDIPSLNGMHDISSGIIDSTNSWQICSFEIGNEYIASVAYSDKVQRVSYFQVNTGKNPGKNFISYLKASLANRRE